MVHRAVLYHAAALHDDDVVRDLGHDAEIMGDKHDPHVALLLLFADQCQDLFLSGYVQRGSGFIGDQQLGFQRQRHGDHHPLPLPA